MFFYKNSIKTVEKDHELVTKFYETVDIINEKKVLKEMLSVVNDDINIGDIASMKDINLLELRKNVKEVYGEDCTLIRKILEQSDYIINKFENEIEDLNKEIDYIVQIYLKAEWIKCKIETRMWPFCIYNEDKVIKKLEEEYEKNKL
jgi:hypothetical protein